MGSSLMNGAQWMILFIKWTRLNPDFEEIKGHIILHQNEEANKEDV